MLKYRQYKSASNNIEIAQNNLEEAEQLHKSGFIRLDELLQNRKNADTSKFQRYRSMCQFTVDYFTLRQQEGALLDEFSPK